MDKETQQWQHEIHTQYDLMISDFKSTVKELVSGQVELRLSLVQLTENLKGLERLEAKIKVLDLRQTSCEAKQTLRISELNQFMYKAQAVIGLTTLIVSTIGATVIGKLL